MRFAIPLFLAAFSPATPAASGPGWRTGTPLALDQAGGLLYAADADRGEVVVFEAADLRKPPRRIPVGAGPAQLAVAPDGTHFVAAAPAGLLASVRPDGSARSIALGGEPYGLVISPDGASVFLTLATGDEVVAVDARELAVRWRTPVPPRPRSIVLSPAGFLAVGHVRLGQLT